MSSYQARKIIPDSWAEVGRCPICNNPTLMVAHQTGLPDQLACSSCGCEFEVEEDGPNIRLERIGTDYKERLHVADGIWMSVVDIRRQLMHPGQHGKSQPEPKAINNREEKKDLMVSEIPSPISEDTVPAGSLNQEEVNRRALGLAALGNEPARIRSALASSGSPEEMISIALEEVKSKKPKRKSPLPLALAVTIIVIVGCLSAVAIYLPKFNLSALIGPIFSSLPIYSASKNNTPTPVLVGNGLPADGNRYFNVIWNLTGNYSEKAMQVASSTPPVILEEVHNQLMDSFQQTGKLELEYQKCQDEYNAQNCYQAQANGDAFCEAKAAECSKENLLFLQEQTKLYSLWLGTACQSFEDYYSTNNVEFPFPQGKCNYP